MPRRTSRCTSTGRVGPCDAAGLMRALGLLAAFSGVIVLGILALSNTVFRPAPAADRLAGVSVQWVDFHITDLDSNLHRLDLTVRLHGTFALDECVGFALD